MVDLVLNPETTPSVEEFACFDINQDGLLNIIDIVQVIDIILNPENIYDSCNLCESYTICTGLIGCNMYCYDDIYSVELLPDIARWDAAGVCGGGIYNQYDVCQSYSDNMDDCPLEGTGNTNITYRTGETMTNEMGETIHIGGTTETVDDYYHCAWSFGDGCIPSSFGRKGGIII